MKKYIFLSVALCGIGLQVVHGQNKEISQLTAKEILQIKKNGFIPKPLVGKNFSLSGTAYGEQGDFAAWFQGKNINAWCLSISGNLISGKKQSVVGNLMDYVQDDDRDKTGNFFLKDCVVN